MIGPVWWFYTVILGVAFGQVLIEIGVSIRNWRWRVEPPPYLPIVLWQVFLLALVIEVWLAVTYYRESERELSILGLMAFMAVPAGILIMGLVAPVAPATRGLVSTTEAEFQRSRPAFFGVLIAIILINLVHGVAMGDEALDADLVFQLLLLAGGVAGFFVRKKAGDTVLAVLMIACVCTYIAVSYSTVPVGA